MADNVYAKLGRCIADRPARREHIIALSWDYGRAWLDGPGVTDLILERAHLLIHAQADDGRRGLTWK